MADYWKSQPRHFCEFCKCWITDNKPSREFHEKGKRHQENVKRKISEVRKSALQKEKREEEENSYMKEMEMNARKAFLKDVEKNPALAAEIKKKKKEPPKQAEQKESSEEVSVDQSESKEEGTWHIAFSPEGYPYYWNDITSEVTWTKPKGYVEKTEQADKEEAQEKSEGESEEPEESDNSSGENTCATENVSSENATTESKEENEPPPPGVDDISAIPLPTEHIPLPGTSNQITPGKEQEAIEQSTKQREATKRPHSAAYGSWEQVKEEEYVDLELPQQDSSVEQQIVVVSEPKIKFKEKKIDSLGADLIAFKKRKQANRSLKQRTTDG